MTRQGNPNGCSMSEFPNGLHGACGPTASYLAAHAINPARWPITAAGLASWVGPQIAAGLAAANGAQNIPRMDEWLTRQGISHTTYGYAGYSTQQLHDDLAAFAHGSQDPVIVEWAAAGLGLPDDEPAVRYHFSAFFQITPDETAPDGLVGGYLRADGDSRSDHADGSPTPCIITSWPEIVRAQPIAHIRVHMMPAPTPTPGGSAAPVITMEHDGAGNPSGAHDESGNHVGTGVAVAIEQAGQLGESLAFTERTRGAIHYAATQSSAYTWSEQHNNSGVAIRYDGTDLAALLAGLVADGDAETARANSQAQQLAAVEQAQQQEETQEAAQPAPAPAGGSSADADDAGERSYVVQANDTLPAIAAFYYPGLDAVTAVALITGANGIANPDVLLRAGQLLIVPPAPAPAPAA